MSDPTESERAATVLVRSATLLADGNPSARACARDAVHAVVKHCLRVPFPNQGPPSWTLPNTWLEAAEAHVARGAQHQYGFQLPPSW